MLRKVHQSLLLESLGFKSIDDFGEQVGVHYGADPQLIVVYDTSIVILRLQLVHVKLFKELLKEDYAEWLISFRI